jgi:hypothetical protein
VTHRFLRLLALPLLLMFACAQAVAADGIDITHAHIEASEDGYKLAANFSFDLSHGLEDAISHGIPLYFTTEIELTRPRWYWLDEKAVIKRQTSRIYYDPLLRQYYVTIPGGVRQTFNSLDDAMFLIRRPSRWLIAPRGSLKPGEVYNVSVRMVLDRDYMPKPMQVNAFNNSEWRLTSIKKTFTYKAE